ncbi:MAG: SAM-dependent methyltransferase [Alphaproteobacteria bacterium]|nr:SAM-dependent methyltransferase [Alphaproteobacteria bacterium]
MATFTVTPIGIIKSPRVEPTDDFWGDLISEIHLDKDQFTPEALFGLGDFSHAEILFLMHKVPPNEVEKGARHPRGRKDWPLVGIFGQRGKGRPNRIGLSRCTIQRVEGTVLTVRALDAIDGTPVLDIKPYMRELDPIGDLRQPAWSRELMRDYYKGGRTN